MTPDCDLRFCKMSDTSTSSKKAAPVRNCPNCKIRMSNIDLDPHVICTSCRGKKCNVDDRCDMCVSWSSERMNAYLKHQSSLERKRKSKKKAKEASEFDFAIACTAGESQDIFLSDDGCSRDEANDVSVSSAAGSANRQEI